MGSAGECEDGAAGCGRRGAGIGTRKASDLLRDDPLSLQGYEGSLIKLTSRQVISLQSFFFLPAQTDC